MKNLNEITQDYKVERTLKGESYDNEMIELHHAIMDIYSSFRNEIVWKTDEWEKCYDRRSELIESEEMGMTLMQEVMALRKVLKTMFFIVKVNLLDIKLDELMEDLN